MRPPPLDAEPLLEHAQWIRRLARTLVHSADAAEDLSQETWKRVLEHPPRLDQPFRGWIATVMRNLVRLERRGSARRAAREARAAHPEAQPSSHDVLERAALQRELVQAVLELDEPYRTTLLLRYFEDLAPSAIAAREGVPLATVKTRLARGLARLRERLERTRDAQGESSFAALAWLAEPIPGATAHPTTTPFALASLAMNAKLVVPLVLVLVVGLAYLFSSPSPGAARPALGAAAAREERAPLAPVATAQVLESAQREVAPSEPETTPPVAAAAAAAPAARVRGRVLDVAGAPVAGVELGLTERDGPLLPGATLAADTPAVARSGADGVFELAGRHVGRLYVRDPSWATLLAGVPVDERTGQECRVVVAARITLAGVVLDEDGGPLAAASVRLVPPATLRATLAQVLDFSADVTWQVETDALGRFALASAPSLPDGLLCVEHEGFAAHAEPAPVVARRDLVLTLGRTTPGVALAGKVVDGAGSPVEAAQVSFGLDVTETDEEGRFAFQSDDPKALNKMAREFGLPVPENLLRALRPGYLPAELRAPLGADGRPAWPAPLVLVLGSTPLTIAGRVLDAHGSPQGGIRVWVADPTFFGGLRQEPAERGPEFAEVEGLLDGRRPGWSWAESDAEGRFALGGLLPRDYVLAALDPSTLQRVELAHVAAGAREVELVFPGGALLPKLAGRVVDGRGEPVPNLSVFPMCDAKEIRLEGQVIATHHEVTRGTSTNAEGWFELERVPKHAVYLRLQGADTLPLEWGRGLAGGLETLCGEKREELVITVERRCHFQVELALAGEADELGLLDAAGETLVISEFFGNGRNDTERHPIVDGRSRMLAASDKAATLVLYRAGLEVRRVAVRLAPGTPQSVKL